MVTMSGSEPGFAARDVHSLPLTCEATACSATQAPVHDIVPTLRKQGYVHQSYIQHTQSLRTRHRGTCPTTRPLCHAYLARQPSQRCVARDGQREDRTAPTPTPAPASVPSSLSISSTSESAALKLASMLDSHRPSRRALRRIVDIIQTCPVASDAVPCRALPY